MAIHFYQTLQRGAVQLVLSSFHAIQYLTKPVAKQTYIFIYRRTMRKPSRPAPVSHSYTVSIKLYQWSRPSIPQLINPFGFCKSAKCCCSHTHTFAHFNSNILTNAITNAQKAFSFTHIHSHIDPDLN